MSPAIKPMCTSPNEENPITVPQDFNNRYISLPEDAARCLKELATKQRITIEEALRRAVATEVKIYEAREKKAMVLLRYPNGEIEELLFRTPLK